jgi:peptidoglycan/xylan/chitin deacetylase (PgdA/CDA1 family)
LNTCSYTIFLISILIFSGSIFPSQNYSEEFDIIYNRYVRCNDSTTIILSSNNDKFEPYQFRWKTNSGTIESSGMKVIYYSPTTPGEAVITLEIFSFEKLINSYSFNLSIYSQLIILKADDLIYDDKKIVSDNWTRFLHYAVSKKIKASVGLICNSLETEDGRYFGLLQYLDRTGYIELWNHGYDHRLDAQHPDGELYDEFRNSSLDFQKEQLRKAQTLADEKLNITLRTFGAPGNAIDSNTISALKEFDEIKVWFFGLEDSDKLVLGRSAEMEYPTGKPDYNSFVQNYDPSKEYLVFQIHPNQWDEDQFDEFKKIISYLKDFQTTFILPYEYYNSISTERIN